MTAPVLPALLTLRFNEDGQPYVRCPECPCEFLVEDQDCQVTRDLLDRHTSLYHG